MHRAEAQCSDGCNSAPYFWPLDGSASFLSPRSPTFHVTSRSPPDDEAAAAAASAMAVGALSRRLAGAVFV